MKKILDEDIINNLLNIKIREKMRPVYLAIQPLNDFLIYEIIQSILDILRLNLGIANIVIPVFVIKDLVYIYKEKRNNIIKLKLYKKKMRGKIIEMNLFDEDIIFDSLINSTIIKSEDSHDTILSTEDFVLYQKSLKFKGKPQHKVFLLDKNEQQKIYRNYDGEGKLLEQIAKKERKRFMLRKFDNYMFLYFKLTFIMTFLILGRIGLDAINFFKHTSNMEIITKYYNYEDDTLDDEIDKILKNIERDSFRVTDDNRFKVENIGTKEELHNYLLLNAIKDSNSANKEEKEVMYNFIDFFNDNPYLDKEKTYENLANLNFDRDYNPFSIGIDNNNGIVTLAYFNGIDTITYCCEPTIETISHEITHAIFNTKNIPISYVEGMAELVQNEYFSLKDMFYYNAYNRNVAITKFTMELIGRDTFLKAFSLDDREILENALQEVLIKNNPSLSDEESRNIVTIFLDKINKNFTIKDDVSDVNLEQFYNNEFFNYIDYEKINDIYNSKNDFYYSVITNDDEYYLNLDKNKTLIKTRN